MSALTIYILMLVVLAQLIINISIAITSYFYIRYFGSIPLKWVKIIFLSISVLSFIGLVCFIIFVNQIV